VHEVVVVGAGDLGAALLELLRRARLDELGQLGEELLEPGRDDELDEMRRLRPRVPERVRDILGLEDVAPGTGDVVAVADAHADLAADDVGQLVLAVVDVRRDQPARVERVLDDRDGAAGHLARDLEVDPDAAEGHGLALAGLHHDLHVGCHLHASFGVSCNTIVA
jgi:hypothetical protein